MPRTSRAPPLNAAYFASKHATLALTECLHLDCLRRFPQIQVSVVCPSAVTTRIFEDATLAGSEPSRSARSR